MMFEMAIKARLPLVAVHTTDLVNHQRVITRHIPNGKKVAYVQHAVVHSALVKKTPLDLSLSQAHYMVIQKVDPGLPLVPLYEAAAERGVTVIIVNYEGDGHTVFDCGELPVPRSMVVEQLTKCVPSGALPDMVESMRGLTLKEVEEVLRLTSAHAGELTPKAVDSTRKRLTPARQGLSSVSTDHDFYVAPGMLVSWVESEYYFFKHHTDQRLCPRGLLFYGPPGVGKTEGARYLAAEMGVPLYRLDIGMTMNKYVGESEMNLARAWGYLIREAPCVMLLDEVEKLFSEDSDQGVTTRMLAHLLWLLQEHRERILTIMTTNDKERIPPELYREGRVDAQLYFNELGPIQARILFSRYVEEFFEGELEGQAEVLEELFGDRHHVSQASVIVAAKSFVKDAIREKDHV